ncbi:MAG TPA: glucosamine-6-phosphate deaminase [bacterium]|nr:glucosamine-6-phosphate deaminase [bacterium]HPP30569.1 glucosamine-6-phosphate deaminase [bacterium]
MESRVLKIFIAKNNEGMGKAAATDAGAALEEYTKRQNKKCLAVFAAAPSQDTFLQNLSENKNINWENIYAFHLDEYIDLPRGHPNTFQEYLKTHIFGKVPIPEKNVFFMKDFPPDRVLEGYTDIFIEKLREVKYSGGIYAAFIGIGVNGHIAFNEPGTDIWTDKLIIKIRIDDVSVKQQYEDYKEHSDPDARYKSLEEVPRDALTMTCSAILMADKIFCMVPGAHKADAVKKTIEGEITDKLPASLLRLHRDVSLYLDKESSSKLLSVPGSTYKEIQ